MKKNSALNREETVRYMDWQAWGMQFGLGLFVGLGGGFVCWRMRFLLRRPILSPESGPSTTDYETPAESLTLLPT